MDRSVLLAHLRKTRFAPGDRNAALADARRIADYFHDEYSALVIGVGSLFESPRTFRKGSDIDIVVKGVPPEKFILACVLAEKLSAFEVNLIPMETANELMQEIARTRGVKL